MRPGRHRLQRRKTGWRHVYWVAVLPLVIVPWYAVPLSEWLGVSVWVEMLLIMLIVGVLFVAVELGPKVTGATDEPPEV